MFRVTIAFIWTLGLGVIISACATGGKIETLGPIPRIGIITDCQYADQPDKGLRHYRLSPAKLTACVDSFNRLELSHVFHLGDFIDEHGMESMAVVSPLLAQLRTGHTLVLGNHDFTFPDELKPQVPEIMGLDARYFSLKMNDWKFIVLDGNDVSLYAWPKDSPQYAAAKRLHEQEYADRPEWNGAIGPKQLNWLKKELQRAQKSKEKVILFCHFPVLPEDPHILWNAQEVVDLISDYSCVKAWMNGHNHAGDYTQYRGIHFLTFKGMVDTETNAYATLMLFPDEIVVNGRGREPDRVLRVMR